MSTRGRVVLGVIGLDQHEVGALAVAQLLTRHGFEVIYLGRFQTPQRMVAAAVAEDAEIVGVSCHSWEFTSFVPELVALARQSGLGVVVGGSVITEQDADWLRGRGVHATFGPLATDEQIVTGIGGIATRVRDGLEQAVATDGRPLADRVVAITGAGRGLGRCYTEHLAALGAQVVVNDVGDVAADVAASLVAAGGSAVADTGDIASEDGAQRVVEAALRSFGRLDALVNNAGILRSGLLLQTTAKDWDAVHRVHLRGTFLTTRAAGRHWREQAKAGHRVAAAVVNTTSAAGLYGFIGEAAYSAAKAGIAAFSLVAAAELARYGVTVNAIAPAARTRMTIAWVGEGPGDPTLDPLAPEHVAPLVGWLVGPQARDVTGRVFEIGNGSLAVVDGWRPNAMELPCSGYDPGALVRPLLARAATPVPVLRAEL